MKPLAFAAIVTLCASPSFAQLGQLGKLKKQVEQIQKNWDATRISQQEEQDLGAQVSERIRQRYGVVQDPAVHKYVSLVGTVLAEASSRPKLPWTFVVLDTDAVNAFAAPGGYVHITRGALGLIKNEAELAGTLGHEITHITEKHTLEAIQKNKLIQAGTSGTLGERSALLEQLANRTYELVLENSFDRDDEQEADRVGATLANEVGYAPSGLATFLQKLSNRNSGATQKRGLFASHPEMQERIDRITRLIESARLTARATVQARYARYVSYDATPQAEIAVVEAGSAGLAEGSGGAKTPAPKTEEGKKGFGLGRLLKPGGAEKQSAQVTASGGARGVGDPERDAKGGSNPTIVIVRISAAEIAEFKKGIAG
jgi:predicted Zn-dependent protease